MHIFVINLSENTDRRKAIEKQLKDLDAALKDIDIYKAMKEKTGVSSHATGGRISRSGSHDR